MCAHGQPFVVIPAKAGIQSFLFFNSFPLEGGRFGWGCYHTVGASSRVMFLNQVQDRPGQVWRD